LKAEANAADQEMEETSEKDAEKVKTKSSLRLEDILGIKKSEEGDSYGVEEDKLDDEPKTVKEPAGKKAARAEGKVVEQKALLEKQAKEREAQRKLEIQKARESRVKEEMRSREETRRKLEEEKQRKEEEKLKAEQEEMEREKEREREREREKERQKAAEKEKEKERDRSRNILEVINESLTESFAAISLNSGTRKLPLSSAAGLIASAATTTHSAVMSGSESAVSPPWVKRYLDYSAKYGLGYQLHDGTVGAFFNDSTKITFLCDGIEDTHEDKGFMYLSYVTLPSGDCKSSEERYMLADYPASLHKKVNLLKHFSKHLRKQQLEEEKDQGGEQRQAQNLSTDSECVIVEKWLKTKHAVVFRLSNRVIQVLLYSLFLFLSSLTQYQQMNFFDETKVVLSAEGKVVTYIDKDQEYTQTLLSAMQGPLSEPLTQRLKYTKEIIHLLLTKKQKAAGSKQS